MSQHTRLAVAAGLAVALTACTSTHHATPAPPSPTALAALPAATPLPGGGYNAPIAVSLGGTPTSVRQGRVFTLHVAMGSGYGGGNVNGVNWGDGSQLLIASAGPNCGASPGPLEPLPTPEPGSHESTYRHVYFTSGSHTITVIAGWPNFCGDNRLRGGGRATLPVTVTAAAIPGNGPNDPVPTVGITPFARTNSLTGDVAATDPDGYVRTLVVNFGDGSAPRTFHNTAGCQAPRPAWHDSQYRVNWSRTFAPGRHTITLRATSTDCSGGSSQVITLERTIDVTTHGFHDVGTLHYRPHEPYYAHIDDTLPA